MCSHNKLYVHGIMWYLSQALTFKRRHFLCLCQCPSVFIGEVISSLMALNIYEFWKVVSSSFVICCAELIWRGTKTFKGSSFFIYISFSSDLTHLQERRWDGLRVVCLQDFFVALWVTALCISLLPERAKKGQIISICHQINNLLVL